MADNDYRDELEEFLRVDLPAAARSEATLFDELAGPYSKSIVIFGAGGVGRKVLAGLRRVDIEPLAFIDNNSRLWGSSIEGIEVHSPQDAANRFSESAAVVIAVWSEGAERRISTIRDQLAAYGFACVISFVALFRKYPRCFLPHGRIDVPSIAMASALDIGRAFNLLADDESRKEFFLQLRWLLSTDFGELAPVTNCDQYFEHDLYLLREDEFFVDCGAFDGDTIRSLRKNANERFSRVIALEPEPKNVASLRDYLGRIPVEISSRIQVLPLAVGSNRCQLRFESLGLVSRASDAGQLLVQCESLDEILADQAPTLIKMDIEGAELDAIEGARNTVRQYSPLLAICVYHRQSHLWQVPLAVNALHEEYKLFIRRYGNEYGDIVCYAIPRSRSRFSG